LIEFFQSVEEMDQKALECPCIADLRSGPCGFQFSEYFWNKGLSNVFTSYIRVWVFHSWNMN